MLITRDKREAELCLIGHIFVVVFNNDACFYESLRCLMSSFIKDIVPDVRSFSVLIPYDCATTCSDRQLNHFETLQKMYIHLCLPCTVIWQK